MIYLDNHATTQLDPNALHAMLPWLGVPANTGSRHDLGKQAKEAVERARGQVAALINADPREIIFTSGATEANNLAIKGVGPMCDLMTTRYEHKSILESAGGREIQHLEVGLDGLVNPEHVKQALRECPKLVSVMWANNEVGTINDIAAIGAACCPWGGLLHTDAAQAAGKVPIDVKAAGVAMLSMSAHKLHGPQGVGALFVSKSKPRVRLNPLLEGGGQERGMRSGTLNVAGIVGFGEACAIAAAELDGPGPSRVTELRDYLLQLLLAMFPGLQVNGSMNRLPGNLNVSIPGIHGPTLVEALSDRVALSNGSACNTGSVEPSYVLMAMGIDPMRAHGAVRFGLSKNTTLEEIKKAVWEIDREVGGMRGR